MRTSGRIKKLKDTKYLSVRTKRVTGYTHTVLHSAYTRTTRLEATQQLAEDLNEAELFWTRFVFTPIRQYCSADITSCWGQMEFQTIGI